MVVRRILLLLALPGTAFAQDNCPDDPSKTEPGLCGCGVTDTDLDDDGVPDACIHPDAVVGSSVVFGRGGRVDAGAVVGEGAVVARRAHVHAGATLGAEAVLGPMTSVGVGSVASERSGLMYGAAVGEAALLGIDTQLGAFAWVGDGALIGDRVVLGRGSWVGDGAVVDNDAVVGPMVTVEDRATVGDSARLRRGAMVGQDAVLGSNVRVGRDVVVGRGAVIGTGTVLRGDVVIGEWATVGPEEYLPRGAVVDPVNDAPVIWGIDAPDALDLLGSTVLGVDVEDPQVGQELSAQWSFVGDSAGWSLTDADTFTPTLMVGDGDSVATVDIEVMVSDGALSASASRMVAHRNDPPVFDSIGVPDTLDMDSSTSLTASATDPQGQDVSLAWSFVGSPSGWSLTADGTLSVGGFGSAQTATVRVTASDGYAAATSDHTVTLVSTIPSTCADLQGSGMPSGTYTIQPPGGSPMTVYCDMTTAGGGWTLIANRRAGNASRESCGSRLMDFFTNGCGSPSSIGINSSYAMNRSQRTSIPRTQVLVIQYLNGTADTDDAYILDVSNTDADLFPNTASLQHIGVRSVCTLSGSCDSSSVVWKYIGDYWFHSASCNSSSSGSTQYRGNYGVCHNGASAGGNQGGNWVSAFAGNRDQYYESKLWGYNSQGGHNYQERIFYR